MDVPVDEVVVVAVAVAVRLTVAVDDPVAEAVAEAVAEEVDVDAAEKETQSAACKIKKTQSKTRRRVFNAGRLTH